MTLLWSLDQLTYTYRLSSYFAYLVSFGVWGYHETNDIQFFIIPSSPYPSFLLYRVASMCDFVSSRALFADDLEVSTLQDERSLRKQRDELVRRRFCIPKHCEVTWHSSPILDLNVSDLNSLISSTFHSFIFIFFSSVIRCNLLHLHQRILWYKKIIFFSSFRRNLTY